MSGKKRISAKTKHGLTAFVILLGLVCAGLTAGIIIQIIRLNPKQADLQESGPTQEDIEDLSEADNDGTAGGEVLENVSDGTGGDTSSLDAGAEDTAEDDSESAENDGSGSMDENAETEAEEQEEYIQSLIADMTIEEKICQMIFLTPEGITGVTPTTAAGSVTKEALHKYPVGGLILLAQNIVSPEQILEMTSNIQNYVAEYSEMPMFIGVDEEGGRVLRVAKNDSFGLDETGTMLSIAETGDVNNAYEAGNYIGTYLHQYGFNIDFAPDADVITEPTNEVIGDRSFGTNPELVADYSEAYLNGLHDAGILGCPKHYPGHGATVADTHKGAAVSERTWDELLDSELVPFIRMIDMDVSMIMASHIEVPKVTGDQTPTTLSEIMLTEKLRDELGYEGVIITDAMNMGAITNSYTSSDAAVRAVKAGADMLLTSESIENTYNGLLNAVSAGEITEERIDESVARIFRAKLKIKQEDNNE